MSEPWKIVLRTALAVAFLSLAPGLMPGPWTSWTWTMQPPRPAPEPSSHLDRTLVAGIGEDRTRPVPLPGQHLSTGEGHGARRH